MVVLGEWFQGGDAWSWEREFFCWPGKKFRENFYSVGKNFQKIFLENFPEKFCIAKKF
jgi:hypothetical protein